jgi:hypothetical protein
VFLGRGTPDPTCWKDRNAKGAKAAWELNDSIGDPTGQLVALKPRLFVPGHVAEMGHGLKMSGMMPFCDAFGVAALVPAANSAVLIWGERLVLDAGRAKERPLLGR